MGEYIKLKDLEIYKMSRELSVMAWDIYNSLMIGSIIAFGRQFLESTDSIGANIAEGYGRFHFLDKVKFYYNARGSLLESGHWIELIFERKLIREEIFIDFKDKLEKLHIKINTHIKINKENNDNKK